MSSDIGPSITSAYCGPLNPGFLGASEKPYPGRLKATTWKLGWFGELAVSSGSNFFTSRKLPGPEERTHVSKYMRFVCMSLTSMNKEEWDRILYLALLVDVVDVECPEASDVDVTCEHR